MSVFQWLQTYGAWLLPIPAYVLCRYEWPRQVLASIVILISAVVVTDLVVNRSVEDLIFGPNTTAVLLPISLLVFPAFFAESTLRRFRFAPLAALPVAWYLNSLEGLIVATLVSVLVIHYLGTARERRRTLLTALLVTPPLVAIFAASALRSFEIRREIWQSSLEILSAFPQGIGVGNFPIYFSRFKTTGYVGLKGYSAIEVDPHQIFLNALVTFGVGAGALAILVLALALAVAASRGRESASVVVFFLLHAMVGVNSFFINLAFATALGVVAKWSPRKIRGRVPAP